MLSSVTAVVLAVILGVHGHAVVEDPPPRKVNVLLSSQLQLYTKI